MTSQVYKLSDPTLMNEPEARHRILVVEDDPEIAARLTRGLKAADFNVELVTDGALASEQNPEDFALVVLDLNLPELDGFGVLEHWRSRTSTPVIVLTANIDLHSRLRTFDLGAVDFMPKPFWMEELVARIHSRVRIRPEDSHRTIELGQAHVDLDARTASVDGKDVGLTSAEFNVLGCLLDRPGRALTRRQIADLSLPADREHSDRVVDSHVARIRKKLKSSGDAIVTVWGIGYRFDG